MREPPPDVLELPLEVRAELAMQAAVENTMEEHMREGRPFYIWRDGKVVGLTPEEMKAILDRRRDG
jgi:hypothetical protein